MRVAVAADVDADADADAVYKCILSFHRSFLSQW